MPSSKTFVVLILCGGIVISIWLLIQIPVKMNGPIQNTDTISVDSYINENAMGASDWEKILVGVDNKSATNLTNQNAGVFEESTLTAQMAKDFFSQYLLLKKGGQPITPESVNAIVQNTLSLPEYTKSTGPVYTLANLLINPNTDATAAKKYMGDLNQMIKNRNINENDDDPIVIVAETQKTEDENVLKKLDPIISKAKAVISDLLIIEVPSDAVSLHLNLINAGSNVLSNLEAMRVIFSDPVRSLSGTSEYTKHLLDLQNALKNINDYLKRKLGL